MPKQKSPARRTGPQRHIERARTDRDLSFRAPLLARGHATFEGILDATGALLEESGIDAVTTNHVARAAGINVATLYHYFPNKQAILLALFQRQTHRRATVARDALDELRAGGDWRMIIGSAIDAVIALRLSQAGTIALRVAMRSNSQLKEHDREDTLLVSNAIAERILGNGTTPRDEAAAVAFCSVETIGALLDAWQLASGTRDDRIVVQLKRMIERYLAPYFDVADRPGPRSRR